MKALLKAGASVIVDGKLHGDIIGYWVNPSNAECYAIIDLGENGGFYDKYERIYTRMIVAHVDNVAGLASDETPCANGCPADPHVSWCPNAEK